MQFHSKKYCMAQKILAKVTPKCRSDICFCFFKVQLKREITEEYKIMHALEKFTDFFSFSFQYWSLIKLR